MKLRQHRSDLLRRVGRLHGAAQLALLLIAGGYWLVQVAEGSYYRELAENNRLRKLDVEAQRGLILDRYSRPLVENAPSYALAIDRRLSQDLEASLSFAAGILRRPKGDLEAILAAHRSAPSFQLVRLAEGLSLAQVARIAVAQLEHPELEVEVTQLRLYRHAHRTAHVLGYLGEVTHADLALPQSPYRPGDLVGKKGLERLYEERLRGSSGEQVVVVDSRGQLIEELDRRPASSGQDLTLTLDLDLQQQAARLLEGRVGVILAMDPRQGDILAMASSPAFDPNRFARRLEPGEWRELLGHPHHPLQNRALQNTYPPGSVFKIVMAVAGLERGLIDPQETKVFCRGFSRIYNNRYRCWKAGGHGEVDLRRSLKHSCNVYYHQLGQKLGIDVIATYARAFGLGSPTGIDLAGEKAGLVPGSTWSLEARGAPWYPGETISVATGQGPILVTPLQIAVLMAAVANGGVLVRPRLVRDAAPSPSSPPLPFAPQSLALVREALWSVVSEPGGTGDDAFVEGLDIAGKTGTAQVIAQESRTDNEDLAPEHRDHAWFASFAPFDDPRLVVVIFVEHGGGGSAAAAPLAKEIYETYLDTDFAHRTAS